MGGRRSWNAKRLYKGSSLQVLNEARSRAAELRPLRLSDKDGDVMARKRNVCSLKDLVDDKPVVDELAADGDSHLLVADDLNPGYFRTVPLFDYSAEANEAGEYLCDVMAGAIALKADTLLVWM